MGGADHQLPAVESGQPVLEQGPRTRSRTGRSIATRSHETRIAWSSDLVAFPRFQGQGRRRHRAPDALGDASVHLARERDRPVGRDADGRAPTRSSEAQPDGAAPSRSDMAEARMRRHGLAFFMLLTPRLHDEGRQRDRRAARGGACKAPAVSAGARIGVGPRTPREPRTDSSHERGRLRLAPSGARRTDDRTNSAEVPSPGPRDGRAAASEMCDGRGTRTGPGRSLARVPSHRIAKRLR